MVRKVLLIIGRIRLMIGRIVMVIGLMIERIVILIGVLEAVLTCTDHCCFGSMCNSGDFSSQNCMFEHMNYYGAWKRPHLETRDTFVEYWK